METRWKKVLRDSLRTGTSLPDLHPTLLASYFIAQLRSGKSASHTLQTIKSLYLPTPRFFSLVFASPETTAMSHPDLVALYTAWRGSCKTVADKVGAVLVWAGWLLRNGKASDGAKAVEVVRKEVRSDEGALGELESGWKGLLDDMERTRREEEVVEKGDVEESEESEEDSDSEDEETSEDDSMDGSESDQDEGIEVDR
jgi:hypothetical protein